MPSSCLDEKVPEFVAVAPQQRSLVKTDQFRWREFLGYFLASALALLVDAGGLFFLVKHIGWNYIPSAIFCFVAGSLVAFILSSTWVFDQKTYRRWHDGFLIFSLIGLVGLLVNVSVLWVAVDDFGFALMPSKAAAAVMSFGLNFVLRKIVLFTQKS
jgi:putative flippase GtrA